MSDTATTRLPPGLIDAGRALLGDRFTTNTGLREHHSHGQDTQPPVMPDAVAFVETTEEVSKLLALCHMERIPVVPWGAGTSLEGHVTPVRGGVTLDLSRMTRIIDVSQPDMDCRVEAGVTRDQLNAHLRDLGLFNTISGLVLVHVIQGMSFTTLFCRNYYVSIPQDLLKAARIDGAGYFRIFWRIVLPLSPPILIVTVIWQFTGIWNEYLYGVTFSTGEHQPITAALIALSAQLSDAPQYGKQSAAVLMAAAPTLLVYLFGGRYFVRGLTAGAVK